MTLRIWLARHLAPIRVTTLDIPVALPTPTILDIPVALPTPTILD